MASWNAPAGHGSHAEAPAAAAKEPTLQPAQPPRSPRPPLRAKKPAGFAESHKGGQCRYTPCEGAALRCVGLDDKGRPVVAFTYRKIDPSRVTLARDYRWPDMSGTKPRGLFIGRI